MYVTSKYHSSAVSTEIPVDIWWGIRGSNPFNDSIFVLKAYLLLGEEASVHQVFNELPKAGTLVF